MVERLITTDKDVTSKKITPVSPDYQGADLEAALAILSEAKEKSADSITLLFQLIDLFNDYKDRITSYNVCYTKLLRGV